jgi:superfamily II DNA or RNA helicase
MNAEPISTRDFELTEWQRAAVASWAQGKPTAYQGTLEIFTGGGKSLVGLACAELAARVRPDLQLAIVVPTEALARQWIEVVDRYTNVGRSEIGLLGAGGKDDLASKRVLITVLNTAAKRLPELAAGVPSLMLLVDECHRAGAPSYSRVLETEAAFRLGLSATPDRAELDDDGEPLEFDEQVVGRMLGPVVYRFGLRDARLAGWLPNYELHHHGVTLTEKEREEYERISRRVDDAADQLRELGVETVRARQLQAKGGEIGAAASAYVTSTARRKDLLYRASGRGHVAATLVQQAINGKVGRRVLLFHERVADAEELHRTLSWALPEIGVRLEHSQLSDRERQAALDGFRSGDSPVLVSVKSLVEGIDVPDAEVGVSVAASSSVRQRVQSLGRVLRRRFDEAAGEKRAEMHLLYVADSVDEVIYAKEDWSDLTGEGSNRYWRWGLDPTEPPVEQDGPPATPRPSEASEWARLGEKPPASPIPWQGSFIGQEYSVDTLGSVTNRWGALIANPQNVADMVFKARGRPGGRFRVTPQHRLVLVTAGDGAGNVLVAGALGEAFRAVEEPAFPSEDDVDVTLLKPGDPYPGPATKEGGSYTIRQKRGGVIERKVGRSLEFALGSRDTDDERGRNADEVLDAWRTLVIVGLTINVNGPDHIWYTEGGVRRFLAHIPGGFAWPTEEENEQ